MSKISKRILLNVTLLIIGLTIGALFQPFAPISTLAQSGCRTFPETGKQVCGRFLEHWNSAGGLAQQGLPISYEFVEVSDLDGRSYTVQYFERAVFEKHPLNDRPYDVLLSQLGTFQFNRKYPDGETYGVVPPTAFIRSAVTAKGYKNGNVVGPTTTFSPSDPSIYCVIEVGNPSIDTTVQIIWTAVDITDSAGQQHKDRIIEERDEQIGETNRTMDFAMHIDADWPIGKYKVDIYLDNKYDRTLAFEVRK